MNIKNQTYLTVAILGKSFKLNVKYKKVPNIELNVNDNDLSLYLPLERKNLNNVSLIAVAIRQLYSKIAPSEIEICMETVRHILRFSPEDYEIKRLHNSFYKCVLKNLIIDPDIIQYNKDIICTTLIQAFCKCKYKVNSIKYKEALQLALAKYENLKKFDNNNLFEKIS